LSTDSSTTKEGALRLKRHLDGLATDNLGEIVRPIIKKVREHIIPLATKLTRTTNLPTGIDKQEEKYAERVEWPRSRWVVSIFREQCDAYQVSNEGSPYKFDLLSKLSHPFRPSTKYEVSSESDRVKDNSKKNGGLPEVKSKGEMLAGSLLDLEQLKADPRLERTRSIIAGGRTQQSQLGAEKVRLIMMVDMTSFLRGVEAFDSALFETDNAVDPRLDVFLFHTEPSKFKEWYSNYESNVNQWVNMDWSNFDQSVEAWELRNLVDTFAPEYQLKELEKEWVCKASILTPWGEVTRNGGMPSGWIFTNTGDSHANVQDSGEAFHRYKLDKYIKCLSVNGDDITFGLTTKLTEENLSKIESASRRTLNVSKVELGDYVWNSKWVICKDSSGEVIMTRPVWRIINASMFAERQKLSIYGSKEYVELALASQLTTIEEHPFGDKIIEAYARKVTKYHISTMTDDQLAEPLQAYVDAHNWQNIDAQGLKESIEKSYYYQVGS
jgi:hypothetical protein